MALDGCLFPLAIKCKTSLTGHDTRGLRAFRETYAKEKIAPALIIYAGRESQPLDQNTTAIPWNI